jgi:Ca-activated chloride channel family protein
MTGGRSFTANDGGQLLEVCRQIDEMERQPILSPVYRRYHEYYPWLALAAVALAAAAFGLEQTVWRRLP